MTQDGWLAIAHHLGILSRLVRVDRMYGVVAGAVLLIGLARLQWGAKPGLDVVELGGHRLPVPRSDPS